MFWRFTVGSIDTWNSSSPAKRCSDNIQILSLCRTHWQEAYNQGPALMSRTSEPIWKNLDFCWNNEAEFQTLSPHVININNEGNVGGGDSF